MNPNSLSPEFSVAFKSIRTEADVRIAKVTVSSAYLTVHLEDGRMVSAPFSWWIPLSFASQQDRSNVQLIDGRLTLRWPALSYTVSVEEILIGRQPESRNIDSNRQLGDWTPEDVLRLRRILGLTKSKLAGKIGCRRATISDWEHGKRSISPMGRSLLDQLLDSVESESAADS